MMHELENCEPLAAGPDERSSGMDLEAFRLEERLTYRALASFMGRKHAGQMRSWALGEVWPDADQLAEFVDKTSGKVTISAMHARRLQWLRNRRTPIVSSDFRENATECTLR